MSLKPQTTVLTGIREIGKVLDDELEGAVGGRVLRLDELRLEDDEVHEDVAGGDEGVAKKMLPLVTSRSDQL